MVSRWRRIFVKKKVREVSLPNSKENQFQKRQLDLIKGFLRSGRRDCFIKVILQGTCLNSDSMANSSGLKHDSPFHKRNRQSLHLIQDLGVTSAPFRQRPLFWSSLVLWQKSGALGISHYFLYCEELHAFCIFTFHFPFNNCVCVCL